MCHRSLGLASLLLALAAMAGGCRRNPVTHSRLGGIRRQGGRRSAARLRGQQRVGLLRPGPHQPALLAARAGETGNVSPTSRWPGATTPACRTHSRPALSSRAASCTSPPRSTMSSRSTPAPGEALGIRGDAVDHRALLRAGESRRRGLRRPDLHGDARRAAGGARRRGPDTRCGDVRVADNERAMPSTARR